MSRPVPNLFPTVPSAKRIALIGEAPGFDEERCGKPFVGASGRFLSSLLGINGVTREQCFLGNVSQHHPPQNKIELFRWDGDEVQSGLEALKRDIATFNPNVIVLLGNVALKAAKDSASAHPLIPRLYRFKNAQWRGSIFAAEPDSPFASRKCLSTYHPAYCLRDYELTPFLDLDLRKAVRQGDFPDIRSISRNVSVPSTVEQAVAFLDQIRAAKLRVSVDIEGWGSTKGISCCGFGMTPSEAFVIPITFTSGAPYWSNHADAVKVWRALANTLEDPSFEKLFQYGMYDSLVLAWRCGILVRNYVHDSIHKHWALYSELAKADDKKRATSKKGMGLAIQASIYTDMPYYKAMRDSNDDATHYEYCGLDCLITKEVDESIDAIWAGEGGLNSFRKSELESMKRQDRFNSSLIPAFRYLMLRGQRYDAEGAKRRQQFLQQNLYAAQAKFNRLTGFGFSCKSVSEIKERAAEIMLTKKRDRPRKEHVADWLRFNELWTQPFPNITAIGEIENLCKVSLNLESPKQITSFLYENLKLPTQYNDDKENPRPTADYEALLKLSRICQQKEDTASLAIIQAAIEIRALETRQQMLSIKADVDGRIRCGYNIVGTNTGRIACSESPTGSGYNLQTIPNYTSTKDAPGEVLGDRDLFLADPDHWYFQCDLKGADGWTVAAYCAMLGDDTMMLDYRFGLKPYNILCLKLRGYPVNYKDRNDIKEWCKKVEKDAWDAFASKRVQHGGAYLEGGLTISRSVLKDSEGKLYMPPKECDLLKQFYFERYFGIPRWHTWIANRLRERPVLQAASGQVRQFFGRSEEILTKAVAFEPQSNTTYATNLAMHKLWTDSANRIQVNGKCKLRIEPLHQVHDALNGQFRKKDSDWAVNKIRRYFDNPIKIAGQEITIPFDGAYGISWGNLREGKI